MKKVILTVFCFSSLLNLEKLRECETNFENSKIYAFTCDFAQTPVNALHRIQVSASKYRKFWTKSIEL